MKGPVDVRGIPLTEGALVCYTTNSRGSGLQFGTVRKIHEKVHNVRPYDYATGTYGPPTPKTSYKVSFNITDVDGNIKYQQEWDADAPNPDSYNGTGFGKHVPTDKPCVSGIIDNEAGKFLIL